MLNIPYYLEALRRRVDRPWFNWRCREIYQTPPLRCDPEGKAVIVSQLYSPDVVMYLLAAKSLGRYLHPREFVIVDDGLTEADRVALQHHLDKVSFTPSSAVKSAICPSGGTWERLLTLSAHNKDHYVIQLDADTLTVSAPDEVLACVEQGRTFTLGTPTGQHLVSAAEAAAYADIHVYEHVQSYAERALVHMPDAAGLKYVRGCSGFTGFAQGQLPTAGIEAYARDVSRLIGADRFAQWGSEQVTSNLMAANAPNALVLPVDTYPFWIPGLPVEGLSFIHFFGTYRYEKGVYLAHSLRLIHELNAVQ